MNDTLPVIAIEPFAIHIADAVLADLRRRLAEARFPDALSGGWEDGAALPEMRELVAHWREGFSWRKQEEELNRLPQFRAAIDGETVHFVHVRGRGPRPMPLVVTHGWPGSFVEMRKLIPLLADPGAHGGDPADAFDVVVPSLPGYGFSGRPSSPGMNAFRIADLWARLMTALGYARFSAQGGDFGASVATGLALEHRDRLTGIHLNYVPGSYAPDLSSGPPISPEEQAFLADRDRWVDEEGGYQHEQRTRPQTLAYALNDSPAGLAAWIVEKFRSWSDCGGDWRTRFTAEELLTNVTIYWATGTIGSSMRLYREMARRPVRFAAGQRVRTPTAVARFAKEEPMPPRSWVERGYDVVRWTEFDRGGHFAAMEEPELLAQDVRAFFRPLRENPRPGGDRE
ncbi:MAG TPA: epoxide hydrolase [Thermoanaerobaculia bacterium]|nr:epoxide hydrolase [Thermoanaerobaculia bacterium]